MLRTYLEYAKKSFQNSIVYRLDTLLTILNTVISIFVYTAIWTAIYNTKEFIGGYTLKMVTTHYVITIGLSTVFNNMTREIPQRIVSGEIASEMLKPVNLSLLIFSKTIGRISFRFIMQFVPAFILSYFLLGIFLPISIWNFFLFLFSVIQGLLIYYFVDLIVSYTAFWFHHVFCIQQIKNAIITILSGALLPIWFLPDMLIRIIKLTPFESIYHIPISIYLGKMNYQEIAFGLLKQSVWIIILIILSQLLFRSGVKKLVIQGG